ncbi:MAG TPA: maleylpyruvate isomerase family mycothiol-dependent enzyme, partial [Acidimicrobiia bacterium]|nr:maleylpyruvate isomerase family mycothiol-dependent enzyme [Acidimicrobiia bacterium]
MGGAIEMYRRSVEDFGQRVMAIGAGDWDRPTPCADWTVRALVRHLVYEELWTPPLLEGQTLADVGDRFEGDILGADPQVAWKEAAAAALSPASPEVLTRTVHLSFG